MTRIWSVKSIVGITNVNTTRLGVGSIKSTGNFCVFIGVNAGLLNTADNNTFIGTTAGASNTIGVQNTALGSSALNANTTGVNNTMIGFNAGLVNTGNGNTFIGTLSGDANTSGIENTALGVNALGGNITGSYCTVIGINAGFWKYANANLNTLFIGPRPREFDDTRHDLSSYALVNLTLIGKNFINNLEIKGSIFNLFDKSYKDSAPQDTVPTDYPQPGRSFIVELQYQF